VLRMGFRTVSSVAVECARHLEILGERWLLVGDLMSVAVYDLDDTAAIGSAASAAVAVSSSGRIAVASNSLVYEFTAVAHCGRCSAIRPACPLWRGRSLVCLFVGLNAMQYDTVLT